LDKAFYVSLRFFDMTLQKKRKKSRFLDFEKRKNVFSNYGFHVTLLFMLKVNLIYQNSAIFNVTLDVEVAPSHGITWLSDFANSVRCYFRERDRK